MGSMVGETPLTSVTCKTLNRRVGSSLVDEVGTRPDNWCFRVQNGLTAKAATNRKQKSLKLMASVMGDVTKMKQFSNSMLKVFHLV